MNKLTKLSRAIVAIAMMLAISLPSLAHDFEVDGIYYNITNETEKSVAVSYKGSSWGTYSEYSNNVSIPESVLYNGKTYSVTSIDPHTFDGCAGLTSITIGNSVTSIGKYAFSDCTGMTSITIGNSVTSIGEYTFSGCTSLTSITFGNSVASIGKNAFSGCESLTTITIPSSVTKIDTAAFYGCNKLSSLIIEDSKTPLYLEAQAVLTNQGKGTFFDSPLETVYLGRNLSYDYTAQSGYSPFYSEKLLKSVVIGDYVTDISRKLFSYCSELSSVTIPNSVITIGMCAFERCSSLTGNLIIPNSVVSIGDWAFTYCSGLTEITIPNSATIIGQEAFSHCSGLTGNLAIPNSVTSIGKAAFFSCSKLVSVNIPNSITTIETQTFYQCKGLISVKIPNSVTSIGSYAFYECLNLKSLIMHKSVTSIGGGAFKRCSNLVSVTIPDSVTSIGGESFADCSEIKSIFYNAVNCISTQKVNLECSNSITISKNVKNIPDNLNSTGQLGNIMISLSTAPPTCGTNSFTSTTKTKTTLYVPKDCYAAYWSAPVWQDFTTIKRIEQVATAISLPESMELTLNNSVKIEATLTPTNTTITTLYWETSNPEVATVDQEGNVTAVANGKATITAMTIDGSELSASCEVKIGVQDVESISISQKSAELKPNEMLNLSCSIIPENATNKAITWTSDNTSIAVVRTNSDGSATVLAVAPGIANITATTNDGTNLSDTCVVKVLKLAESITLNKTTSAINTGETIDLNATVLPDDADYKNVTWATSDEALATVKDNGNGTATITAVNPGVVTITATTADGSNLSASCEITITKLAESITLDKTTSEMLVDEEETLTATILPDNTSYKVVTWTSSDESLATVKDNGDGTATITAINPGVVTITATTADGSNLSASCEITITKLAESITLDKTTAAAFEGEIIEITATILPDNTSDKTVAWTISDESVASLKDNGDGSATISVIKVGITTVTASTTDGSNLSATCEISGLSGISNISIDGNNDEKRYDVHGRLLSKPTPGINIIKMSDGSTRKEWVK